MVLRRPLGTATAAGQPGQASDRLPVPSPRTAGPLPRRSVVGARRLAPAVRSADPADRSRAASELRLFSRAARPTVAARGGQVAAGHPAGGGNAALDDGEPGTAELPAALRQLAQPRLRQPGRGPGS